MGLLNTNSGDSSSKDTNQTAIDWNELTDSRQLDEIASESAQIPVIIFKHSTRCGISRMSLKMFESEYSISASEAKPYFLDLLNHRDISNAIAQKFGVYHESPQLILIKRGKAVYHESHGSISAQEVKAQIDL